MSRVRSGVLLIAMVSLLVLGGCENTTPRPEVRADIEAAVTNYLHALTRAYSTLSVEPLEGLSVGSEIEDVRKMLRGLAGTGDRVEARMLEVDFTRVDVFREVNATVATTEVWDVTRYDAFNGREKGRNPTSIQDSIMQLRLVEGRWVVTARRVLGQEAGPRWHVDEATPVPAEGE